MQRRRVLSWQALLWGAVLLYGAAFAHVTALAGDEAPPRPHVAALLPLESPAFGRLADAVRRGLEAAASAAVDEDEAHPPALPLVVVPVADEGAAVVQAYRKAVAAGARFVVGPLARNAVRALAASGAVNVPTLALSLPETDTALPEGMMAFGVSLEAEARQVARLAASQGRRRAAIVAADSPLSRRASQAFGEAFAAEGGEVVARQPFAGERPRLKAVREALAAARADAVFFALDGPRIRQMRPFLDRSLPGYATSQAHSGDSAVVGQLDLAGIVFVDMPWLVAPEHPAVAPYWRPPSPGAGFDQERFFAMGLDAWQLASQFLAAPAGTPVVLDGASGQLAAGDGGLIRRSALPAQFTATGVRPLPEATH